MSSMWVVEYQRKHSDTNECLWVSVDKPMSMARADLKAARVNVQRLALPTNCRLSRSDSALSSLTRRRRDSARRLRLIGSRSGTARRG
jgi:hypothetical protein